MHELLNFRCTRCSDRDARLGYFLLHINTLGATGGVDAATLELAAARAAAGDAVVSYDGPVDLAGYDRAFELLEGGAASA